MRREKINKKISGNQKEGASRKIKVVFLIGQLGLGGSERQLFLLLKHIDRELFDCHVIVFNPSPNLTYEEPLNRLGIRVLSIPPNCRGILARMWFIYRKLRKLAPDVVHSWTFHDNSYAGVIGCLARVPVRLGSNRVSLKSVETQSLPFLYRFTSLYSVSAIVINSNDLLEELTEINYAKNKIVVVQNCVEMLNPDSLPDPSAVNLTDFGIENYHRIVGVVGNLRRQKNHLMFVEGMAQVMREFSDVRALIVGHPIQSEPELKNIIKLKIKSLGMEDRIILAGFRDDVPALMHRLSVFCLTSNYEGMPNVMLEAMAAGCPVVATNVQGVKEIVKDGVNGLLVEPGDVDGFASAVETLLNNQELSEKLGNAGRVTVERRFGCEQMALQLANLYREALIRKGSLPG